MAGISGDLTTSVEDDLNNIPTDMKQLIFWVVS